MTQDQEPLNEENAAEAQPVTRPAHDLFPLWMLLGFGLAALLIIAVMWNGYSYYSAGMKADKAIAAGDYDKALPYLQSMVAHKPSDWYRQRYLGEAYMFKARPEPPKALEHYMLALKYNPDLINMNETLGICYSELGDQAKANEYFSKLMEEKPDNPAMNYYLGVQQFNAKHFGEAARCFQAASADPKWDKKAEPYRRQMAQIVLNAPLIAPKTETKPKKNG